MQTPVLVVAGWGGAGQEAAGIAATIRRLLGPGTVVVHHDLRAVAEGMVLRRVTDLVDGGPREQLSVLELAHGCVSCTLREDLLPLLRRLGARPDCNRIVLALDPSLEPEAVCWAIRHVVVDDRPLSHDVRIEAVITTVDAATWLDDATGDTDLAERGWVAGPDDERTVAQVAVGQVEFADAVIITGEAPGAWEQARLHAVLDRLAPGSPRGRVTDVELLLGGLGPDARRGEVGDAHTPLLRGQPTLTHDSGVGLVEFGSRRPFHPERLHHAVDVLLDGVVRARGRMWLATQPDDVLWLESAGTGLRVGTAGPWLATLARDDERAWQSVDAHRRAMAALRWDPEHGDRGTDLVVLVHAADPNEVRAALARALLTDDEMSLGQRSWLTWDDPFAQHHADPCADSGAGIPTTRGELS